MSSYKLTIQAEQDYRAILEQTLITWGTAQFEKYAAILDKAFERLATMPRLGTKCNHIREGYYRYHIGRHYVFYRIVSEKVEIVRLLDDRRDIQKRLFLEEL